MYARVRARVCVNEICITVDAYLTRTRVFRRCAIKDEGKAVDTSVGRDIYLYFLIDIG